MKFGNSNHQNVKMPHWIWSFGPDLAPLSRNRVKNYSNVGLLKNQAQDSRDLTPKVAQTLKGTLNILKSILELF